MLDVGTNRESLLDDGAYIGNRHARIRGERYDAFVDAYVEVVTRLFPRALLQWEDFSPTNGRRILERYRDSTCSINDDMQGTGAITLAAAISAVRVCGTPLRHHRVVIFGAGTAGIGIADQIRDAMVREGLSPDEATRRFWCVDRAGLLTADMTDRLRAHQLTYARPAGECQSWKRDEGGAIGLAEVMRGEPDDAQTVMAAMYSWSLVHGLAQLIVDGQFDQHTQDIDALVTAVLMHAAALAR